MVCSIPISQVILRLYHDGDITMWDLLFSAEIWLDPRKVSRMKRDPKELYAGIKGLVEKKLAKDERFGEGYHGEPITEAEEW